MTDVGYIRVRDVMTVSPHAIHRTATISEAVTMMSQYQVSSLVVERHDDADEFGLITVTDIAREVVSTDRAPERVNVYEVMTKPVLTVPEDMNIKYAVRLLVRYSISRALVVDAARRPVGITTLRDMVLCHSSPKPQDG